MYTNTYKQSHITDEIIKTYATTKIKQKSDWFIKIRSKILPHPISSLGELKSEPKELERKFTLIEKPWNINVQVKSNMYCILSPKQKYIRKLRRKYKSYKAQYSF